MCLTFFALYNTIACCEKYLRYDKLYKPTRRPEFLGIYYLKIRMLMKRY